MAKQDSLDLPTRELVRFAAAIAQGDEPDMRERVRAVRMAQVPVVWVEELLLQSILMCGYPRALVAMTVWRKFSGLKAPSSDPDSSYEALTEWTRRGEATCGIVYGENYRKLRDNVRAASRGRRVDDCRRLRSHALASRPRPDAPGALYRGPDGDTGNGATAALPPAWRTQRRRRSDAGGCGAVGGEPDDFVRRVAQGEGVVAQRARWLDPGELAFNVR